MSRFMRQFRSRNLFLKFSFKQNWEIQYQKLHKTYVGKAGTIAKNEFGIFETLWFTENSE